MLLLIIASLVIGYVFWSLRRLYNFWGDLGTKQRKQTYFVGDFAGILLGKESISDSIKSLYDEFPEERYVGFYQLMLPTLMVRDPELIKKITIKDFDHFVDHRQFVPEGLDPLWNDNLFALNGNKWRRMRVALTPSFTTSKMKMLHQLVCECALNFTKHFSGGRDDVVTLNFKDVITRFTCDMIASIVFCVKCDSLKERKNEFYLKSIETTSVFRGFWRTLRFFILITAPEFAKLLRLSLFNVGLKNFFSRIVKENIRLREEQRVERQDMLNVLLETRKGKSKMGENEEPTETGFATTKESTATVAFANDKSLMITDDEIAAQTMIFLFGGVDTIAILISFMAYELALNADVQSRLREEIDDALRNFGENLQYDVITKLKYMEMVMSETMRKWPLTPILERTCVKPYTIAPETPGEKPVRIKKGDIITIPICGLHLDPKYYERPEEFDPERFSDDNKSKINPFAYIPFGTGPRNCIGSRFSLLAAKVFFFHLLAKFELVTVKETPIPLKLKKFSFSIDVEKGFWIGLKHRSL